MTETPTNSSPRPPSYAKRPTKRMSGKRPMKARKVHRGKVARHELTRVPIDEGTKQP